MFPPHQHLYCNLTTFEVVPTKVTTTIWCETFVAYPNTGSYSSMDMTRVMQKRHFELIGDFTPTLGLSLGQVETLANLLNTTNVEFKKNRFLDRCADAYERQHRILMAARIRRLKSTRNNGGNTK